MRHLWAGRSSRRAAPPTSWSRDDIYTRCDQRMTPSVAASIWRVVSGFGHGPLRTERRVGRCLLGPADRGRGRASDRWRRDSTHAGLPWGGIHSDRCQSHPASLHAIGTEDMRGIYTSTRRKDPGKDIQVGARAHWFVSVSVPAVVLWLAILVMSCNYLFICMDTDRYKNNLRHEHVNRPDASPFSASRLLSTSLPRATRRSSCFGNYSSNHSANHSTNHSTCECHIVDCTALAPAHDCCISNSFRSCLSLHLSAIHPTTLSPMLAPSMMKTTSVPYSANLLWWHRLPKLPFPMLLASAMSCCIGALCLYLHVHVWIVSSSPRLLRMCV